MSHPRVPHAARPHADVLWTRDQPVLIRGPDGALHTLRFAYDTEIPTRDVFHLLSAEPVSRTMTSVGGIPLRSSETQELQLSHLTDSGAESPKDALGQAMDRIIDRWIERKDPRLLAAAKQAVEREGLQAAVDYDDAFVELSHASSEPIPSRFKDQFTKLSSISAQHQPQVRIGIPAEALSSAELLAVARAAETRSIFRALDSNQILFRVTHRNGSPLAYSELRPGAQKRGLVRADPFRWQTPVLSHDLELRHEDVPLDGLEFAVHLIQGRSALLQLSEDFTSPTVDARRGNICGALNYVARLLEAHGDRGLKYLIEPLKNFADRASLELSLHDEITQGLASEIRQFVHEHEINDLLSPNFFLNQPH